MIQADFILDNTMHIANSSNELLNRHTINRNFKKLLENDLKLNMLYDAVIQNKVNIQEYTVGKTYNKGQLVWYACKNMYNDEWSLYLLESLRNNNNNEPKLIYNENNEVSFIESGWKDKNEYTTIIENGLSTMVVHDFVSKIDTYHEYDTNYHKFSKLTGDKAYNDTKLLLADMSNIDTKRSYNYFPYETVSLKSDNVIVRGFYRKWDNGLLEYDILFKLASVGIQNIDGANYEILSCNTLTIPDEDIEQNKQYFSDLSAQQIFLNKDTNTDNDNDIRLEYTIQKNRNDYVNTYSATLIFPESFYDTNYMIFQSDIRCQERNTSTQTIDAGSNTMTYTNKKKNSIIALYVMFPDNQQYNARRNGLITNTFHCQIIGRWK